MLGTMFSERTTPSELSRVASITAVRSAQTDSLVTYTSLLSLTDLASSYFWWGKCTASLQAPTSTHPSKNPSIHASRAVYSQMTQIVENCQEYSKIVQRAETYFSTRRPSASPPLMRLSVRSVVGTTAAMSVIETAMFISEDTYITA